MSVFFFFYIREFANQSFPQYLFQRQKDGLSRIFNPLALSRLIAPNDQELRLPGKIDSLSTAWGKLYKTSLIKEHGLSVCSCQTNRYRGLTFQCVLFHLGKKPSSICLTCSTIIEKQHHLAKLTFPSDWNSGKPVIPVNRRMDNSLTRKTLKGFNISPGIKPDRTRIEHHLFTGQLHETTRCIVRNFEFTWI